jgi:hypothetical protein
LALDWDDCSCQDCVECGGGGEGDVALREDNATCVENTASVSRNVTLDTVAGAAKSSVDTGDTTTTKISESNRSKVIVSGCQMCVDFPCCPDHCCGRFLWHSIF